MTIIPTEHLLVLPIQNQEYDTHKHKIYIFPGHDDDLFICSVRSGTIGTRQN